MPTFSLFRLLIRLLGTAFQHRGDLAQIANTAATSKGIPSVMAVYQRGDYETASKLSEQLKRNGRSTAPYCYYAGLMEFELGNLELAEQLLRESLSFQQEDRTRALACERLGKILLAQGRFDEARAAFLESIQHWPDRGCAHRGIAEVMLASGADAEETLARAKTAVKENRQADAVSDEVYKSNIGESLATLAWATAAATGAGEWDIDKVAAEATGLCGKTGVPTRSQVYFHLAQAYATAGVDRKAVQYFEQTAKIDPHGHYGRLAQYLLSPAS